MNMKYIFGVVIVIGIAICYFTFSRGIEPMSPSTDAAPIVYSANTSDPKFDEKNLFEGCVKFPQFSISSNGRSPGSIAQLGGNVSPSSTVMQLQQSALSYIKDEIAEIKTKVPANFVLGKVTMDKEATIKINPIYDISFPSVRMNFVLNYPTQGPTGDKGKDAATGPTGPTGPTGQAGDSGYWGTIKNTLY
jgi:hypothetical protein